MHEINARGAPAPPVWPLSPHAPVPDMGRVCRTAARPRRRSRAHPGPTTGGDSACGGPAKGARSDKFPGPLLQTWQPTLKGGGSCFDSRFEQHEEGERQHGSAQAHYNLMRAGALQGGDIALATPAELFRALSGTDVLHARPKQAVYKQHY